MNAKKTIGKILLTAICLAACGSLLTLLVAANDNKRGNVCAGHKITVSGHHETLIVGQKEILEILNKAAGGQIKDRPLSVFNLLELEKLLTGHVWIEKAELWFDSKDMLHIKVKERFPVARIITTEGNSFYVDRSMHRMPVLENLALRLPVFTGFPEKRTMNSKDSVLMRDLIKVANIIVSEPFWNAQVAQVDITRQRDFEMVPVIGNHIVRLGNAEQIEKKFSRLHVFYSRVLSKTGFDRYKIIDVQYKGQVVGSRE